jgi:peptidoglycan-associated lipoprotein
LIVHDRVFFGKGSDVINSESESILDDIIATTSKYCPLGEITVEGHADEIGSRDYNLALSKRRALAVGRYLATLGIKATRIDIVGIGSYRPAVLGHTESAYAFNRRVVIVPKTCR